MRTGKLAICSAIALALVFPVVVRGADTVPTATTLVAAQNPMKPGFLPELTATVVTTNGSALPVGTLTITLDGTGPVASKSVTPNDASITQFIDCCHWYGDYDFTARYMSTDGASTSSATLRVVMTDLDPPSTQIANAGWYTTSDVSIPFTTESDATSECRLEGEEWQACVSPWTRTLADGKYTLEVISTDSNGNRAVGPALASFAVDTTPPTGTFLINGGAPATQDPVVTVTVDAHDNVQPVWTVYVSLVPNLENGVLTSPYGAWSQSLVQDGKGSFQVSLISPYVGGEDTDGAKTVYVQFQTGPIGQLSEVVQQTIALDRTPPTIGSLTIDLSSARPTTSGVPYRLAWASADIGTGVHREEVQRRVDGGSWVWVSAPAFGQKLVTASAGKRSEYRVRSVDRAGNVGPWSNLVAVQPIVYQETSSRIVYGPGWVRGPSSSALGGYRSKTTTRGATATFSFSGREVIWIGSRGRSNGSAEVYIDGVLRGTIDAYSSTSAGRVALFSRRWTTAGTHTVRIVSLEGGSSGLIDIDAFIVAP